MEYDTARIKGIPIFVFVRRDVQTLLQVWRKNPDSDFAPTIDYPEVFKFLERIAAENRWIFSFEKTGEITETLSIQLSSMLRDLLERSRRGTLIPQSEFLAISQKAEKIAREKPEHWEFLLTAELLSAGFANVRHRFDAVRQGRKHVSPRMISGRATLDFFQEKLRDLEVWVRAIQAYLPQLKESWGPPGFPGDAHAIKRATDELIALVAHAIEWEESLQSLMPPDIFANSKKLLQGWTENVLSELETFPHQILSFFNSDVEPTGTLTINMTLNLPEADELCAEIARIRRKPELWKELRN